MTSTTDTTPGHGAAAYVAAYTAAWQAMAARLTARLEDMPDDPAEFAPAGGGSFVDAHRDAADDFFKYINGAAYESIRARGWEAAKAAGEGSSSTADTTPPREGMRVECVAPYLAAVNHPDGEEWTRPGECGTVVGVGVDTGLIWVKWDRDIPGLGDCGNEIAVTSDNAAANGRDLVADFWTHFRWYSTT